MEDKTTVYMLVIVGIVLVVGITSMVINAPVQDSGQELLTGNAVLIQAPVLSVFGKVIVISVMIGVGAYMYFRKD